MKNKFLYGTMVMAVVVMTMLNITFVENDNQTDLSLVDVEAWADNEWNDWNQWLTQGLTKDEREEKRPCPTEESSTGSGSISHGDTSISGGGSHSQTNPATREEYICPQGNTNCTAIGC